jgi:hypothetical protein
MAVRAKEPDVLATVVRVIAVDVVDVQHERSTLPLADSAN